MWSVGSGEGIVSTSPNYKPNQAKLAEYGGGSGWAAGVRKERGRLVVQLCGWQLAAPERGRTGAGTGRCSRGP